MNNKQIITHCLLVCLFASPILADYTYVVDSYQVIPSLYGTESLLVFENGGGGSFDMWDSSFSSVQSTSALGEGTGGLWEINLFNNSQLDFSGGELRSLDIFNDATAIFSGGSIVLIESNQYATSGPHITVVYSGDLPTVDASNVLTGLWGSGDPFSIYLSDVSGYSPAIDNIQFQLIPEPATLAMLGFGGLLIRRKK